MFLYAGEPDNFLYQFLRVTRAMRIIKIRNAVKRFS